MPSLGPTSRSHSSSTARRPVLEILPDTNFIVFHGNEHEASSVKLTGTVRLTTPEPMSIQRPKIRLEGKRKVSWWYMGGMSAGEVVDKRIFWNQEQKLGNIESSHKVKAGTIEWPFEFELAPSMPESVEGLRETYIVYHLHASVSRPGWNARDVVAQEHIRIVRTLGADSMEMTRSRVNADIWANKVSYSISIPTDAIVFGTSITADVELSPIKKGLKLGKVELRLVETTVKRIQAHELPDVRGDRTKSEESEVAKFDMEFPEDSRLTYEDETVDNPAMADEMYKFRATLPLPKSLNQCRQDVDSHQINITHKFKLMVNIHNPEGHVSQLVCRLPVKLFISPNLPVDEQNMVCPNRNGPSDAELNDTETTVAAPPVYGRHVLDQMYMDIDPSGFMSRAGSGPGTPADMGALSRRGSQDNTTPPVGSLGSLGSLVAEDTPHAYALHTRLADLQNRDLSTSMGSLNGTLSRYSPSGGSSPAPGVHADSYLSATSNNPSNGVSTHVSASTSGRNSNDDMTDGLHRSDYDLGTLSRVPSYGAATRTPAAVTPLGGGPPTYFEATSRPPSPTASLRRPGQAHTRSPGSVPSRSTSIDSEMGALSMSPTVRPTPRAFGVANDEHARLRSLRIRR